MKKIIAFALVSSVLFSACKKAFEQPVDFSSVAVIQASPVAITSPTDTLHVFLDTLRYNSTGILYNANTTYLPVRSGAKTVNIRRGIYSTFSNYVNSFGYNFDPSKAYSFFVYDTATTAASQAKILRLTDDLTLPAAATSHVRLLHLAPNAPAVDVTLVRTSVTPNDSVTISNKTYVGASPNEATLSAFTPIPRGVYTAKVKLAGTQTVVISSTATLLTAAATGAAVSDGRIVTLYVTGTAKGRPVTVGAFRHY